jgi:hypothetical protein
MGERIDIDHTHSSAISQEIGERLQLLLGDQPGPAPSLRRKLEMLRRRDVSSPSNAVPRARATGKRGEWLRLLPRR